jgi:alpha-L-fucosidase
MPNRQIVSWVGAAAIVLLLSLTGSCSWNASAPAKEPASRSTPPAEPAKPLLSADPPAFQPYTRPPQKAAALARWRDASFGLFLHFGVYSTFGGEYEGRRSGAYGEWLMHDVKIPLAEYRKKVAGVFNPTEFNADECVRIA